MSLVNSAETSLLQLLFNATTWNNIAENDTTSPSTAFYVSLHTASPGETGAQNTTEAAYGAYARQSVTRGTAGWTVSGASVSNAGAITFPEATSGSETETDWGVGLSLTGAGTLLAYGNIDTPTAGLSVSTGVQPQFAASALSITAD
jgi:hypothetical protein